MRILALDTTTARESVALVEDGEVRGEVRLASAGKHSRRVMPAVAFLLESLEVAPGAVDGYAVTLGPGSFTGLRIGISTIQGLALAAGRPCVGLSALDVLAARIAGSAPTLAAVMDASRGEVFLGVYDSTGTPLQEPLVATPDAAAQALPVGTALAGEGADGYRAVFASLVPEAVFPSRSGFLAGTLGRLAHPRLAAGRGVPPDALRPLYLRSAHIRGRAS